MSLILATGSNLGDSLKILNLAAQELSSIFSPVAQSQIYYSEAVDYTDQPNFYNQVLEFKLPPDQPLEVLSHLQSIEQKFGGHLKIDKGPRFLDIDILFWAEKKVNLENLTIPHPEIKNRSFVLLPLSELPFYRAISQAYPINNQFSGWAKPIDPRS